jgi:hypothetical protein
LRTGLCVDDAGKVNMIVEGSLSLTPYFKA